MPRIPGYEQQTRVSGAGLGGRSDALETAQIIGRGLEDVAINAERLRAFEQRKREEEALVAANDDLMDARSSWLTKLKERKEAAEEGAPDFTPTILADFDADTEERLQRAKSPAARQHLQDRLGQVRLALQEDAMGFESQSRVTQRAGQLDNSLNSGRTAAEFRPQDFAQIYAEQSLAIQNSGLNATQQRAAIEKSQRDLSSAAVSGMIRANPWVALKELNNEKSKNPAIAALHFDDREQLRNAAESEIRSREADANETRSRARQLLADRVADAQASWLNGADYQNPPTREEFVSAYPADQKGEAERAYNAFSAVQKVAGDLKAMTRMGPAERASFVAKSKPEGGEGAKGAFDAFNILATHAANLDRQLADDPAEYVANYSPGVRTAGLALAKDPSAETMQAYATESLGAQRALGVTQPKILTDAQAQAVGERLKPTGNGEASVAAIAQEAAAWGRYWPQVLSEAGPKLPPAVQVISLGMDPVPAARLASISSMKGEDFAKIIPDGTTETRIRKDVSGTLRGLTASFLGWSGGEEGAALFVDQTTKLAASYMAAGETQSKAVERAANEVVLSRYNLTRWAGNDLRIPKDKDPDLILAGLRTLSQRTLKDNGLDSDQVRWWTTPDDSGVVLKDATTGRTLTKAGGKPLAQFSYAQLQQYAVNADAESSAVSLSDYQGY